MATNGVAAQQALAPILAAVETMQGNVDRAQKEQAVQFLDHFQKRVCDIATRDMRGYPKLIPWLTGRCMEPHIQHSSHR